MTDPPSHEGSPVLGTRIADLRRQAGLTQPDLSLLAGVSTSTVYRAERSDPTIGPRMMARLASALAVDTAEIYRGEVMNVREVPVSATRAEERHDEVIDRLDGIRESVDRLH